MQQGKVGCGAGVAEDDEGVSPQAPPARAGEGSLAKLRLELIGGQGQQSAGIERTQSGDRLEVG